MSFFSRLFRSKPKLMTWQEFVEYFARRIQEELDLEAKIRSEEHTSELQSQR